MRRYKAIVAVAQNGVIGRGLEIPWRISEDFKHFKRTTLGGIIVMGRKTWESLGCSPLPERENVVITSATDGSFDGATVLRNLDELDRKYASDARTIWICGGAKLYQSALEKCDEIILSRIKSAPEGDVFFPDISADFEAESTILNSEKFDVIKYVRRRGLQDSDK